MLKAQQQTLNDAIVVVVVVYPCTVNTLSLSVALSVEDGRGVYVQQT